MLLYQKIPHNLLFPLSRGRSLQHLARIIWILAKNFERISRFSSIDIACCTLYFTRIYLDSCKSARENLRENLCENRFSAFPQISYPVLIIKLCSKMETIEIFKKLRYAPSPLLLFLICYFSFKFPAIMNETKCDF